MYKYEVLYYSQYSQSLFILPPLKYLLPHCYGHALTRSFGKKSEDTPRVQDFVVSIRASGANDKRCCAYIFVDLKGKKNLEDSLPQRAFIQSF